VLLLALKFTNGLYMAREFVVLRIFYCCSTVYNTTGRRNMSFGDFSKCVTHALMDLAFARGGDRRSLDG
jgi:hypothetical protein